MRVFLQLVFTLLFAVEARIEPYDLATKAAKQRGVPFSSSEVHRRARFDNDEYVDSDRAFFDMRFVMEEVSNEVALMSMSMLLSAVPSQVLHFKPDMRTNQHTVAPIAVSARLPSTLPSPAMPPKTSAPTVKRSKPESTTPFSPSIAPSSRPAHSIGSETESSSHPVHSIGAPSGLDYEEHQSRPSVMQPASGGHTYSPSIDSSLANPPISAPEKSLAPSNDMRSRTGELSVSPTTNNGSPNDVPISNKIPSPTSSTNSPSTSIPLEEPASTSPVSAPSRRGNNNRPNTAPTPTISTSPSTPSPMEAPVSISPEQTAVISKAPSRSGNKNRPSAAVPKYVESKSVSPVTITMTSSPVTSPPTNLSPKIEQGPVVRLPTAPPAASQGRDDVIRLPTEIPTAQARDSVSRLPTAKPTSTSRGSRSDAPVSKPSNRKPSMNTPKTKPPVSSVTPSESRNTSAPSLVSLSSFQPATTGKATQVPSIPPVEAPSITSRTDSSPAPSVLPFDQESPTTAVPDTKPTRATTKTRAPTFEPAWNPTVSQNDKPSRESRQDDDGDDEILSNPVDSPTVSPSAAAMCQTVNGDFGVREGVRVGLPFNYELETVPLTSIEREKEVLPALETAFNDFLLPFVFASECGSPSKPRLLFSIHSRRHMLQAVGISSQPKDLLIEGLSCENVTAPENDCGIYRGELGLYMANVGADADTIIGAFKQLKLGLDEGVFDSVDRRIVRVVHLDLGDMDPSDPYQSEENPPDTDSDSGTMMFAIVAAAAGAVLVSIGALLVYRHKRERPEDHFEPIVDDDGNHMMDTGSTVGASDHVAIEVTTDGPPSIVDTEMGENNSDGRDDEKHQYTTEVSSLYLEQLTDGELVVKTTCPTASASASGSGSMDRISPSDSSVYVEGSDSFPQLKDQLSSPQSMYSDSACSQHFI